MPRPVTDLILDGDRVVIDGDQRYVNCTFQNCDVIVSGTGPVQIVNCYFDPTCRVRFEHHAGMVLETLRAICQAMPDIAESVIRSLRDA